MKTADTAHSEAPSAFAQAAELELRNVSKRYAGQGEPAISDLSLTVPAGEVCVLVGPSGSGKTTAMRLINRMIPLSGGDILLGGRSVLDREPRELRREIGYVIQQVGLFPHRTVEENIATVPELLGWPRERVAARVRELFDLIGLDAAEMAGRYPAQLSGGQRQRVGVARALAADPPLMLMDEPFGAIDPINRSRLQDEFLRLQATVRKTVVFVTHDIDEAIKMGDRIAIIRAGGRLAQYDTPPASSPFRPTISWPNSSARTARSSGSPSAPSRSSSSRRCPRRTVLARTAPPGPSGRARSTGPSSTSRAPSATPSHSCSPAAATPSSSSTSGAAPSACSTSS